MVRGLLSNQFYPTAFFFNICKILLYKQTDEIYTLLGTSLTSIQCFERHTREAIPDTNLDWATIKTLPTVSTKRIPNGYSHLGSLIIDFVGSPLSRIIASYQALDSHK